MSPDTPPRRIRLGQFLKWQGLVGTGGEAKMLIQTGEVRVNGEVETRRGRQLDPGDVVEFEGEQHVVPESDPSESDPSESDAS